MTRLLVDNLQPSNGSSISVRSAYNFYTPGSVIQIKQTIFNTTITYNPGAGWSSVTDLDCIIQPSSTKSKIMVFLHMCCNAYQYQIKIRLYRNLVATNALSNQQGSRPQTWLTNIDYDVGATSGASTYDISNVSGSYLDSPSSSGSLKYGIQVGGYSTSYPLYINRSYQHLDTADYNALPISTMTLMEIAH